MKHLILFNYFETDLSLLNLSFFLKHGLIDHPSYHFCFIIKGGICTPKIPQKKNIKVIEDANEGFDFSGRFKGQTTYSLGDFDRFIFINCSARGPFLPRYYPQSLNWVDSFTSHLNDKVKLVGCTINYNPEIPDGFPKDLILKKHIQSYAFATDSIGLCLLMKKKIFHPSLSNEKYDIIFNREIRMSAEIIKANYQLYVFQFSENRNSYIDAPHHGDIHLPNKYYKTTLNPIEIMFIKPSRVLNQTLENYTAWKNISTPRDLSIRL